MADETIGSIGVDITGDWSNLQESFTEATAAATEAGQEIASALGAGGSTEVDNLVSTLGELIAKEQQLQDAFHQAASVYNDTLDAYRSGEASVQVLEAAYDQLRTAADAAGESLGKVGDDTAHAGEGAHEAGSRFEELFGEFAKFAGIALSIEGAFEFLKDTILDAVEAFAQVQKAEIALTSLMGSADKATESIENLKGLALSDALSFPSLVTATQRMTAFGIAAEDIPRALQAAADASAATGNSFDAVTSAITRLSLSGNAGARQLVQLGISATDLANTMGVSAANLKTAFAAMDPTDRINAIVETLGKFSGTAAQVAQSISGQWQNLQTQWEFTLEEIGKAIAPLAEALLGIAKTAADSAREVATQFSDLAASLGSIFKEISADATSLWDDIVPKNIQAQIESPVKAFIDNALAPLTAALKLSKVAVDDWHGAMDGISTLFGGQSQTMVAALAADLTKATAANDAYNASIKNLGVGLTSLSPELKAVQSEQDAANKKLSEAKAALDEARASLNAGAISQGTFNRALTEYEAALDKANPKAKDFKDSVAGIQDAIAKAQTAFASTVTVLGQLVDQSDGSAKSLALIVDAYNKAEAAAKKAGQAFADSNGEMAKIEQGTAQAAASFRALTTVYDDLLAKLQSGTLTAQQQEQVSQQLAATYQRLQTLAQQLGTTFYDTTGAMMSLTKGANDQQTALMQVSQTYNALAAQGNQTATQQEAISASFKQVSDDAVKVGLSVQQVGTGLLFTATGANALNPAIQALAQQMTNLYSNGVQLVDVNGKLVPSMQSLAAAQSTAALAGANLNGMITQTVTTLDGGSVSVLKFVDSATKATAATNAHAQAQQALQTQVISTTDSFNSYVNGVNGLTKGTQDATTTVINLSDAFGPVVTQMNSAAQAALNLAGDYNTLAASANSAASAVDKVGSQSNPVGGGSGTGSMGAGDILGMFGAMMGPASGPIGMGQMDQIAEALGLVPTGNLQYEDVATFNKNFEKSLANLGDVFTNLGFTVSQNAQGMDQLTFTTKSVGAAMTALNTAANSAAAATTSQATATQAAIPNMIALSSSATPVGAFIDSTSAAAIAAQGLASTLTTASNTVATATQVAGAAAVAVSSAVPAIASIVGTISGAAKTPTPFVTPSAGVITPFQGVAAAPAGTFGLPNGGPGQNLGLTLNVSVNGSVVGNNGMSQLSQMIMPQVVTILRQAGAKI